jgi:hypothetical protein
MYLLGVSSSQVSRQFSKPNPPVINSTKTINERTVSISWAEGVPVPNNYPVTSVVVEVSPPVRNFSIFDNSNPVVVNGDFLTSTSYKFRLRAVNIHGNSDLSLETEPVNPTRDFGGGLGTQNNPAPSGLAFAQARPSAPSGYYWIKSASMGSPIQMYVDMVEEGGGYDFYPITNGIAASYSTDSHSGTSLGLDLVYPRSQAHWRAMYNYITNVVGGSVATYLQTTGKVFASVRTVAAGAYPAAPNLNGNYTPYAMKSGSVPDWRVPDGGRWWLKDSAFGEPNGDYYANGFLGLYAASYTIDSNGLLSGFNDAAAYSTGTSYLVSTNAKQ